MSYSYVDILYHLTLILIYGPLHREAGAFRGKAHSGFYTETESFFWQDKTLSSNTSPCLLLIWWIRLPMDVEIRLILLSISCAKSVQAEVYYNSVPTLHFTTQDIFILDLLLSQTAVASYSSHLGISSPPLESWEKKKKNLPLLCPYFWVLGSKWLFSLTILCGLENYIALQHVAPVLPNTK